MSSEGTEIEVEPDDPITTGIPMTKENKLNILTRAREILSDPNSWTVGNLRRRVASNGEMKFAYCVLGACERAAYDLGLAEETDNSFLGYRTFDAYILGRELSFFNFSKRTTGRSPDSYNDRHGYLSTIQLLDNYIAEVNKAAT